MAIYLSLGLLKEYPSFRREPLALQEMKYIVEDQAIIRNSVNCEDILGRSAKTRLTIKQAQLNSRIPPIQFGGFSGYLFVDLLLYSTPRQDEARDEDEKSISQRMAGLSPAAALAGQVR
jgi:hypothetical protein